MHLYHHRGLDYVRSECGLKYPVIGSRDLVSTIESADCMKCLQDRQEWADMEAARCLERIEELENAG